MTMNRLCVAILMLFALPARAASPVDSTPTCQRHAPVPELVRIGISTTWGQVLHLGTAFNPRADLGFCQIPRFAAHLPGPALKALYRRVISGVRRIPGAGPPCSACESPFRPVT